MRIIGVAGTAGAGKDAASDMLAELFPVENISTGDFVRAVTRYVYDLPADFNPIRDQLYKVANQLRSIDPAFMIKMGIFMAREQGKEAILLSGLRSMGEADAVREAGGIIVGIDADPTVRYERIYSRQRDSEASKTFEQFLEQDAFENKGLSDTGPGRGIQTIIDTADVHIDNNGTIDELREVLQAKLGSFFADQK